MIVIKICLNLIWELIYEVVLIQKTTRKDISSNDAKQKIKPSLSRTPKFPPKMHPWHPGGHNEPQNLNRTPESSSEWRRIHTEVKGSSFTVKMSSWILMSCGCCAALRTGWPTALMETPSWAAAGNTGAKCQHGVLWFKGWVQWDYVYWYFYRTNEGRIYNWQKKMILSFSSSESLGWLHFFSIYIWKEQLQIYNIHNLSSQILNLNEIIFNLFFILFFKIVFQSSDGPIF